MPKAQAGLIRFPINDTADFVHFYTDTSLYYEVAEDVIELPDSGYLICGHWALDSIGDIGKRALLIRTDKNGNELWHQQRTSPNSFQNMELLEDGKILVGGYIKNYDYLQNAYRYKPYFSILDTLGNTIKTKYYPVGYAGGGNIKKDKNGGYFHWGNIDSIVASSGGFYELDFRNNPGYVAHLDDSFNFQWRYLLYDTVQPEYRCDIGNVLQLVDSNYLVLSTHESYAYHGLEAKVLKLGVNGQIVWEQRLHVDTGTYDCYLEDAIENSDGSLLLVGEARDVFAPAARQQDFWLVGLDSTGCPTANCYPATAVHGPNKDEGNISVFPNPTTGNITINLPKGVTGQWNMAIIDMQGRPAAFRETGRTPTALQATLQGAPGLYFVQLSNTATGARNTQKVWLQR